MSKRRLLKHAATCIVDSFVSRNNDFEGYWAIGQLRAIAETQPSKNLTIQLRPHTTHRLAILESLSDNVHNRLLRILARKPSINASLSSAFLALDFDLDPQVARSVPLRTWGRAFSCRVVLTDGQQSWFATAYSCCGPHDPERETRRVGDLDT